MGEKQKTDRPDITAATRGGDWSQAMDGEGPTAGSTREEAAYWLQVYTEILAMEEKVLHRIEQLMATQSAAARHEVELTNLPVVVAQAERFRQRRGYWEARMSELDGHDETTSVKLVHRDAGAAFTPKTREQKKGK